MKINNNIKRATICLSLFAAVSCTGDFESVNTNPSGATDKQLEQDFGNIKGPLKVMFNNILVQMPEWKYQIQQNLQGDIWSGYMATGTAFAGGSNNTTYNLIDGWNGTAWGSAYSDVMANALKVQQRAEKDYPEFYAMSLVLKVQAMHRIADIYGPCVYSKFGTTGTTVEYDSQEEVYINMLKDLDIAVGILSAKADSGDKTTLETADKSTYAGDYAKWTRYANSLRLRLALRMAVKKPDVAKSEATKALTQKYGVMSAKADTFILISDSNNPINTITGWGDISMSADMESILGGYQDPRIAKYFDVSTAVPGQFKGIRTGVELISGAHSGFSRVGEVVKTKEIVFLSTAQVYFMKAEAALRGWDSGSAKAYYEAGIAASFEQNGVAGASTYVTNTTNKPKNYVDTVDPLNNATAVSTVTIAWDDAVSNEVKLEKIITQKWIAGFPEGQEAWSEYRRTGYPKLFPILKNTSNGVISSTLGVRRINFVQSEKDGNAGGVATGVAKLGGPDNGATRLWWDTGVNF